MSSSQSQIFVIHVHKVTLAACRVRYREEQKAAEEIDTEVLSLNRKIKLLEDNIKRNEDRSGTTSNINMISFPF